MRTIVASDTVGAVVRDTPGRARVFEDAGIDYCCGGGRTVAEACRRAGADLARVLDRLNDGSAAGAQAVDAAAMSLTELADHIERTHHAYLRAELPRIERLAERVAVAHQARDGRVLAIRDTVRALAAELLSHLLKEERILFPLVRALEAGEAPSLHGWALAGPVQQMELEHGDAGDGLARLRELTDGYAIPAWACNTHRALLDALARLERDTHQHIHKENNVLFPRALELERAAGGVAAG